jgi:hypothetical protein
LPAGAWNDDAGAAQDGTVSAGAQDQDPPAPTLTALSPAELAALRPLLDRGPALLVRDADRGMEARITFVTRARAPVATVRRVITTPGEYLTFMPTLRSVEVLSRHNNRTAFRFHVAAPVFDVTALSAMTELGERRVDVAIVESETGPGGSRWDLSPDGADATLVQLTTWGDPSRGHWMLRQLARRSPAAIAGMNVSADTVLALGVARQAERLTGSSAPVRPAEPIAPVGVLAPPPAGPWRALARDATLLSMSLSPDGAIAQVTVAAWTQASPEAVLQRLRDVPAHPRVWGSIQAVELVPGAPLGEVRYRSVVQTPLARLEGEQRLVERDGAVWIEGTAGDFAGADHRYDVSSEPSGGCVVAMTGGADYNRAGWLTRALMARDPWLVAGFAGSWKIVWLRHLLRGL